MINWKIEMKSATAIQWWNASISCFLCKSELKKDEDEEISLIVKFPLNREINVNYPPVQYT